MCLKPAGPGPVQPGVAHKLSPVRTRCESYAYKQSLIAGIILILTGALAFMFNVVGILTNEIFCLFGHGMWGGVVVSV